MAAKKNRTQAARLKSLRTRRLDADHAGPVKAGAAASLPHKHIAGVKYEDCGPSAAR